MAAACGKGEERPLPNEGKGDMVQECLPGRAPEARPAV